MPPQNPQDQQEVFDPDKFLAERGATGVKFKPETFDPDAFLAARNRVEKRPTAQELLAPPPTETFGQRVKRVISGQGKGFLDTLVDPEVAAATGAGMILGKARTPMAMAGVGAATTAVKAGQKLATQGKSLTPREVASSFFGGAAGEGGARLLMKAPNPLARAEIDPLGQEVGRYFGSDVSAQQLTRSPKLDFMANVARTGLGGRAGMEKLEQEQSAQAIEHLAAESAKLSPTHTNIPPRGTPTHPVEESAGKRLQGTLGSELDKLRAESKTQYGDFLQQHGPLRNVDPDSGLPVGPSVQQLHERRSTMLERARDAFRAGDVKGQAEALKQASNAGARMKQILQMNAPGADRQYDAISGWYKEEINRLDNEMIHHLRQSTKGEDVMKSILGNRLKSFTELGDNVAMDNNELFHALKRAVPPKQWKQTQAELVNEVIEASIKDETGIIDHKKLASIWNGLSPESQKVLFGADAAKEIQRTLTILQRTQAGTKGGPGQLAISVRQPAAFMTLGGGIVSALTGHPSLAAGTLATSAIIASSPYVFYKALTTPFGRSLLVKAATAKGPLKEAAKQALQRYLSQETVQGAKAVGSALIPPQQSSSPDIPQPPQ